MPDSVISRPDKFLKIAILAALLVGGAWFALNVQGSNEIDGKQDVAVGAGSDTPSAMEGSAGQQAERPASGKRAVASMPAGRGQASAPTAGAAPAVSNTDPVVDETDLRIGQIPDIEIFGDYMNYDKETLVQLIEFGDPAAISIGSIHATYFSLAEREALVKLAISHGDLSGLPRMFMEHSKVFGEPDNVDSVKAYGYLLAAQATGQFRGVEIDVAEFSHLSKEEVEEAINLSETLLALR